MKKHQVLQAIIDSYNDKPFLFNEFTYLVQAQFEYMTKNALYQHIRKFVNAGICTKVAKGHYALTQKGLALFVQSERDKNAHAFLQEILNQKASQDLLCFEIKALQDKLNSLQNQNYKIHSSIDKLTTQLLNTVSQDN